MSISAQMIKDLRERTGVGILDCRNALEQSNGDIEKATEFLREKGMAKAAKRADRDASEGLLDLYSHASGRVGVMVEVNCETDFVSRSDDFKKFTHEVALQVAAVAPKWVNDSDIPAEVLEVEKENARTEALEEGKPEHIIDRIIEGKINKFLDDNVLMRQPYIRDDEITIEKLLMNLVAKLGEKIVVKRFARWEVGEDSAA